MGLFQSLTVGVAGMRSQADKLGVVSDNIANVNTVGYKAGVAQFETMVNDFSGSRYIAGGVKSAFQASNQKGGVITQTDSVTDLAISGRGFFTVSDTSAGTDLFYTRAGSFRPNFNGDYINSNGYFLKGWRLDNNGNLPAGLSDPTVDAAAAEAALATINVANLSVAAIPTSSVILRANLKSSETIITNNSVNVVGSLSSTQGALPTSTLDINAVLKSSEATFVTPGYNPLDNAFNLAGGTFVSPHHTIQTTVYDGAGAPRTVNIAFLKTGTNAWSVEVYAQTAANITPAVGFPPKLIASGALAFNTDGTLAFVSPGLAAPATVTWNTPTSTSAIAFDFGTIGTADGIQEGTTSSSTLVSLETNLNSAQAASTYIGYNGLDNSNNMASGAVPAHFTQNLTMYDAAGTARAVKVSYLKTDAHTWAVEIYAQTPGDITPAVGFPPGHIAGGNIVFSANGTLADVSASLTSADVTWNSPASTSSSTFSFGDIGDINGVKESTAVFAGTYTIEPDPVVYSDDVTAVSNYDPTDAANNMSLAGVTPHYTQAVTITDNSGVTRTINANFVKTATNTWAVELTAFPTADLVVGTGAMAGQLAYGTITFKNDGSLESISPSLTGAIQANWFGATEVNSIKYDWGSIGSLAGLKQAASYGSSFNVVSNYSPVDTTKSMASGRVTAQLGRSVDVIGQDGNLRTINFGFVKTAINTWAVEMWANNPADVTGGAQIAHGIVTFNGDGTLASITDSLTDPVTINWAVGAPSNVTLNLGTAGIPAASVTPSTPTGTVVGLSDGLSQFDSAHVVRGVEQNGSVAGENASVSIDDQGFLIGKYTNGSVRRLFKIPLVDFVSPDKLQSLSGNVFAKTNNSGDGLYFQPSQQQESVIDSGALENSNVDLSFELSNMIIAQRSYQSNSKLLTTTDNMLEVVYRM